LHFHGRKPGFHSRYFGQTVQERCRLLPKWIDVVWMVIRAGWIRAGWIGAGLGGPAHLGSQR
jgi:hypothetical protein